MGYTRQSRKVRRTYVLISADDLVDVSRRELIELLVVTEDDDSDVDRAQYRQLVRLLEQTSLSLQKCSGTRDRPVSMLGLMY